MTLVRVPYPPCFSDLRTPKEQIVKTCVTVINLPTRSHETRFLLALERSRVYAAGMLPVFEATPGSVSIDGLGTFNTADASALSRMLLHLGMLAAQMENESRRGEPVLAPLALPHRPRTFEHMRSRYRPLEPELRRVHRQIPGSVWCRPGEVHIAGLVLTFREAYTLSDITHRLAREARRRARALSA